MEISIPNNHNFFEEKPLIQSELIGAFGSRSKRKISDLFSSVYELNTGNASLKSLKIIGFKDSHDKTEDENRLILKLYSKESDKAEKKYYVQTGLFSGIVFHKKCRFNITTRYGDVFLRRMLNYVNDIYVDTEKYKASKKEDFNEFQFILAYLFIQTLEKASVLGLPKEYQNVTERSHKVRGRVDINAYLKHDMPFRGKLTSSYRTQKYIQEIIDVLYLALLKLEKTFGKDINDKIFGVKQLLKREYSGIYINQETLLKAKNHRVLSNPLFASFKKVLEYAEIILLDYELTSEEIRDNELETTGFLFDISQLFELYLEKLLAKRFPDWEVKGQEELKLYSSQFYYRKMFPDLVLKHKYTNKVIVFDAKFKSMRMERKPSKISDLDRNDFYQIHTYMQYYQPDLIFGGLLYPLSKPLITENTHSENLFGNINEQNVKFIVDGIYVNEEMSMKELLKSEKEFLDRIDVLIEESLENKRLGLKAV